MLAGSLLWSLFSTWLGSHGGETVGVASGVPRRQNLAANFLFPWLLNLSTPFCNVPGALGAGAVLLCIHRDLGPQLCLLLSYVFL